MCFPTHAIQIINERSAELRSISSADGIPTGLGGWLAAIDRRRLEVRTELAIRPRQHQIENVTLALLDVPGQLQAIGEHPTPHSSRCSRVEPSGGFAVSRNAR